ncbi:SurA N-terminal domain-containing protein [Paucisalibacillus sp. EB02]|uniref:SurA N-terminal domain-containing protein n=1 Tax=Paucisalibacillus sp. EB02 TaxID=1347087 RepID=UPI0004BBF66C|nr:SurA N-terminal domain-containing protein [Paucisalibacillus sp. EB02]
MKKIISILVIGLIILLAACGDDEKEDNDSKEANTNPQEVTMEKDEMVADDKVVVEINDSEVKGDRYNAIYLQTKMRVAQFGQDTEDKENIKEVTMNELIAQELIKQEAKKSGIEVSDEEVQKEFEELKSQNEGTFNDYLEKFKLTEESLKDQIRFSQTLSNYMDQEIKVEEVTDADIKETYEQLKKDMDDIMTFEEAEPIIKNQLTSQRQADALQQKVEELMKQAEINKHI